MAPAAPALAGEADTLFTLRRAVEQALGQNFALRLARTQAAAARNEAFAGAAGLLPSVSLQGLVQRQEQLYREQTVAAGPQAGDQIFLRNVQAISANANVGAAWTFFAGQSNRAFYRQLQTLADAAGAAARAELEATLGAVITAYYDVRQQGDLLRAQADALAISAERLRLAEAREQIGAGSRLEYLQARVDYNADRSALLRQRVALANAKVTLNQLMNRPLAEPLAVADSITVRADLALEPLSQAVLDANPLVAQARLQVRASEWALAAARGRRWPTLALTAGLNYFQQDVGPFFQGFNQIPLFSRSFGPTVGLQANWTIFGGGTVRRAVVAAELAADVARLREQSLAQAQSAELLRFWQSYRQQLDLLAIEQENLTVARRNAEVALDRFRIGASAPLELREAQNALLQAETRSAATQFEAKLAETALLRLTGRLGEGEAQQ